MSKFSIQNMLDRYELTARSRGYSQKTITITRISAGKFEDFQGGIDLVLLDINMPGLDGFQVLKLIRYRSNLPVIMLTGMDQVDTLRATLDIGADDYITKPFRPLELVARIKARLRRAKLS